MIGAPAYLAPLFVQVALTVAAFTGVAFTGAAPIAAATIVECAPEWRLALVLLSALQRSALLLRVPITG
jgi:hypothetical protein